MFKTATMIPTRRKYLLRQLRKLKTAFKRNVPLHIKIHSINNHKYVQCPFCKQYFTAHSSQLKMLKEETEKHIRKCSQLDFKIIFV